MNFIMIYQFYKKIEIKKVEKFVITLHNKSEYVILIRNFKQELNHRLNLKRIHRMIKFNEKDWL